MIKNLLTQVLQRELKCLIYLTKQSERLPMRPFGDKLMLELVTGTESVYHVDLEGDLTKVVENLGLGLLPDEIEKVREYFLEENRKPTDVELQAIDQAWSEHCCYKSSKSVLEETVFGIESQSR